MKEYWKFSFGKVYKILEKLSDGRERQRLGIAKQPEFLAYILPNGLSVALANPESEGSTGGHASKARNKGMKRHKESVLISPTDCSRFFNLSEGVKLRAFDSFYKEYQKNSLTAGERYAPDNHPLFRAIRYQWDQLVSSEESQNPKFAQRLLENIRGLVESEFPEKEPLFLRERLGRTLDKSLTAALSVLTVLAFAKPIGTFANDSEAEEFCNLIIMPHEMENKRLTNELEAQQYLENTARAEELLQKAKNLPDVHAMSQDDWDSAFAICRQIEEMRPLVDDELCSEITHLCYLLAETEQYKVSAEQTAEKLLWRSAYYGNSEAIKLYHRPDFFSCKRSEERCSPTNPGLCWTNACNEATGTALATMPLDWKLIDGDISTFVRENSQILKEKRLLLLDEDPDKNLEDLLEALDILYQLPREEIDRFFAIVRGPYGYLSSLLDTVLADFGRNPPRVYLLDEEKQAVWNLLFRHPLFYPVRHVPVSVGATLRLIILGGSRVAETLLLESFQLMDFEGVDSAIYWVAPDAMERKKRINARCPGLAHDAVHIPLVSVPEIHPVNKPLDTLELDEWLSETILAGDTCYFIVAMEDARENLTLALRLREWSIRRMIKEGKPERPALLPPIAFYCPKPVVSHLVTRLVAQKPAYGGRWYNGYALIPFGSQADIFRWDEAAGGILEAQARYLHMQYTNAQPHAVDEDMQASTKSRYERFVYAHDSSAAAVLALPYRLFNTLSRAKDKRDKRILPPVWNILDREAYTDSFNREILADRFEDFLQEKREVILRDLSEQEHSRWCRYMLSRGWLPASEGDVQRLFDEGANSHKLYIAKMHGCICSYDDLLPLSELLLENGKERDFYTNDRTLVECTPGLLRMKY